MIKFNDGNVIYGTLEECVDELFKRIDFGKAKFPDFDFAAVVEEDLKQEDFPSDPTDAAESWFGCKDLGRVYQTDTISLFIGHYTGGGIESMELRGEDIESEKETLIARIGIATDDVGLGVLNPDDPTMFEFI